MKYASLCNPITFLAPLLLVACGPETNSRYGDAYWDPQKTWEEAAVVTQPELNIVYRELGTDPQTWTGYVSIDFSDTILRQETPESVDGVFSYSVGTQEPQSVADFLQNGATAFDSQYFYDVNTSTDYRLELTEPEVYSFFLSLGPTHSHH